METWIPVARKILVIGIWIYVGYQMLPAASSTKRNGCLWYFIGLFSFYIPFAVIGFMPPVVMLLLMKRGVQIPRGVFDGIAGTMFILAVSAGVACLHWARRLAARARIDEEPL